MKPWMVWVAGILTPFALVAVYRHFRADPTDTVVDVAAGVGMAEGAIAFQVSYSAGPPDSIVVAMPAALAGLPSALRGPSLVSLVKQALLGQSRDRIQSIVMTAQGAPISLVTV